MTHRGRPQFARGVILAGILAFACGALAGMARAETDPGSVSPLSARPNIVVIMADDLDVGSTAVAIRQGLMPNLVQHVLTGGTTFTETFVTLSLCCPSRSTYLTGQYPHNHGVVRNSGIAGGFERFDDSSTLATWLSSGGYRTAHVGKYLNGYVDGHYVPPGWSYWQALVDPTTYCMYDYTVSNNGQPIRFGSEPGDYQTDVLARLAARFITQPVQAAERRPIFLSIAPLAPHRENSCNPSGIRPAPRHVGTVSLPLPQPPSFNEADMSDKPRWMRTLPLLDGRGLPTLYNARLAALRAVDDLVGVVARALAETGELSRTVFVFTSDNGFVLGEHRWEGKVLLYEESIRVPLFVRVPGTESPRAVGQFALNNDLAPTIADLAGVTPGLPVDGRSLLPLMRGTASAWRRRFLVEYPPTGELGGIPPFLAVRTGSAGDPEKLIYGETYHWSGGLVSAREHYDLVDDPYQLQSLHADVSPRRVRQRRELKWHLERLKDCGGGSCQALEE